MAKTAEKASPDPAVRERPPSRDVAPDPGAGMRRDPQVAADAYIAALIERTGLDRTNLARAAGLAQSTLAEARVRKGHPLTRHTVETLAARFRIAPPPGLVDRLPPGRNRTHRSGAKAWIMESPPPSAGTTGHVRDVPIFGALMISRGPLFRLNRVAVDMAPRPYGLLTARKAYAIRMPDESMSPWRRAGELVFIDPTRPVRRGDHALFLLADPSHPNEEPFCLVREVIGAESAPTARQMAAHSQKGPETFLDEFVATERHRVLEWEEALFG